jgi:RNA polymerase-binding transcription factor DksA
MTITTERARHQEIRRRLAREYHATAARLRALGSEAPSDGPPPAALAGDLELDVQVSLARESHFASRERLLARLHRLAAALARLEDGTYGACLECGQPIGAGRLRAIPEAATCVDCQERLEQRDGSGGQAAGN